MNGAPLPENLNQNPEMMYDSYAMKPEPPPKVPGKTPWERFDNAVRTVFSVPKDAVLKEEARLRRLREKKRKRVKKQAA